MIQVKDIPSDLLAKIREQFNRDPAVQQLQFRQGMLQRQGKFKEALSLAKDIDTLFNNIVYEYAKEAEQQAEHVSLDKLGVTREERDDMLSMCLVMFMCCDIIESAVIDVNDIVHRHDPDMNFDMFNDFKQLKDMAKAKLQYLRDNSGYMKELVWADKCDNMYDMMLSKARSIQRKRKETLQ